MSILLIASLLLVHLTYGFSPAPMKRQAAEETPSFTAVTGCHLDEAKVFCTAEGTEYVAMTAAAATEEIPPSFTGCHNHGSDTFCLTPDFDDVQVILASDSDGLANANEPGDGEESGEQHCHFHAGVEHCVGAENDEAVEGQCEKVDRDYDVPLRVGALFAVLATSAIGVFLPIVLDFYLPQRLAILVSVIKQFGTGIIISTAFVHLLTHANLMFASPCLGELSYEGTMAAFVMAGLFLCFLVEYFSQRLAAWYMKSGRDSHQKFDRRAISVFVLEAGIIFHSILIGVTLVVAGDSYFITLFVVIMFHQSFEGLALGSRIAAIDDASRYAANLVCQGHSHVTVPRSRGKAADDGSNGVGGYNDAEPAAPVPRPVSLIQKILMGSAFAFVTPVGMAIGIGVLKSFDGTDPPTIWAMGTLDAISAGILVWAGVVEMWAGDWILSGGEMVAAPPVQAALGLSSLLAGIVLMSFIGKWA